MQIKINTIRSINLLNVVPQFLFVLIANLVVVSNFASAQISNGKPASNVIGQTLDFSSPSPLFTKSGSNNSPNAWGFSNVRDIELDSVGHRLFVADVENRRVLVFNLANDNSITDYQADYVLGQLDFVSTNPTLSQSGMKGPTGLAYDSIHQRLFVSDYANYRVLVYDVSTISNGQNASYVLGQPDFFSGTQGGYEQNKITPLGLEYDSVGDRLFVSDTVNNRVMIFDVATITNGENAVNVLGATNFTGGLGGQQSQLIGPADVKYDSTGQRLFVADNCGRAVIFDIASITNGENAANVLGKPDYLDCSQGAPTAQNRLKYFNTLAYDSSNQRLFVSESFNNRVTVFDVSSISDGENAANVLGQTNFTTDSSATSQSKMYSPRGLAFDEANQRLLVGDSFMRVMVFDVSSISDGENAVNLLGQVSNFTSPTPNYSANSANNGPSSWGFNSSFFRTQSSALDLVGHRLFVTDPYNSRVLVFNLNSDNTLTEYEADFVLGQTDFKNRATATTQSGMYFPSGILYDSSNRRLFVSDTLNARVLVFDATTLSNGQSAINVLGQADFVTSVPNTTQSTMSYPVDLTLDSDQQRLFVTDSNRILIFNVLTITNGEDAVNVLGESNFTSTSNSCSGTQSSFCALTNITYDAVHKRLFTSDNNRVLVFDLTTLTDGQDASFVLGKPDFTTFSSPITSQSNMSVPKGLAYDPIINRLFAVDSLRSRILLFDTNAITNGQNATNVLGQLDFTSQSSGVSQVNLNDPCGLSYDKDAQRLWASDCGNNRVLSFEVPQPTPTPTVTPTPTMTPTPTTGVRLALKQLSRVRTGRATLRLSAIKKKIDSSSPVRNLRVKVNCSNGTRTFKTTVFTESNGKVDFLVSKVRKNMSCQASAKSGGKQIQSPAILLR